jgi:hypothetical protein
MWKRRENSCLVVCKVLKSENVSSCYSLEMAVTDLIVDLKTISRFAQLEYKYGDAERGKTLFEGIVDSHPKRWDMWSVYMDMEATQGNIQSLRYFSFTVS